MNTQVRPAQGASRLELAQAARDSLKDVDTDHSESWDRVSENAWARGIIQRGHAAGEVPIYGSEEWHELADDDPRKIASAVRSAEAWRHEGEPAVMAARLRRELAEADWMLRMRVAETSHDVSRGWQPPSAPSYAELQQRRAELLQMSVDEMKALER